MGRTHVSDRKAPPLLLVALLAGASLLPLLALQARFRQLFWYGDEWHLLLEIDRGGFGPWLLAGFAENFCPVFKLVWGGAALATGGSYPAMIGLCWLQHACNVFLFGLLLRRWGFGSLSLALCLLVFGLSSTNIETLAWSVQLSPLLSYGFFLLAALLFFQARADGSRWRVALLSAAGLASGLSFSRGVLSGPALAVLLVPRIGLDVRPRRRAALLAALLLPALAVAVAIRALGRAHPQGFLPHDLTSWAAAARFAAVFYLYNPLARLFRPWSLHGPALAALPILKIALVAVAFRISRGHARPLLTFLIAFDLGNSALVGLGRYWTGLPDAISSRYQYGTLLCLLPAAGLLLERYGGKLAPLVVACAALGAAARWPHDIAEWAASRGTRTRSLLAADPPSAGAPPNIPPLPDGVTPRQIAERFKVH